MRSRHFRAAEDIVKQKFLNILRNSRVVVRDDTKNASSLSIRRESLSISRRDMSDRRWNLGDWTPSARNPAYKDIPAIAGTMPLIPRVLRVSVMDDAFLPCDGWEYEWRAIENLEESI